MKNIRTYDYFINNINSSFKVRYIRIFLTRTYIFNLNGNNTIYYRKNNVNRKISLVGKSKLYYIVNKNHLRNINYFKYNIISIDKLLTEYIKDDYMSYFSLDDTFDILETKRKRMINVDCFTRKFAKDEMVTMCFDECDLLSNLVNSKLKNDYYNNVNV